MRCTTRLSCLGISWPELRYAADSSSTERSAAYVKKGINPRLDECEIIRLCEEDLNDNLRTVGDQIVAYYKQLSETSDKTTKDRRMSNEGNEEAAEQEASSLAAEQARKLAVAIKIGSQILLEVLADILNIKIPKPCM
jgi:hypothetical protein